MSRNRMNRPRRAEKWGGGATAEPHGLTLGRERVARFREESPGLRAGPFGPPGERAARNGKGLSRTLATLWVAGLGLGVEAAISGCPKAPARGRARRGRMGGGLNRFWVELVAGRRQRGRKRASRSCRPTPGVAPARATLRVAGFRPCFSARFGKSCQNAQPHFDDFPIKTWRAVRASTALGPGRPRVPAVGNWPCQPSVYSERQRNGRPTARYAVLLGTSHVTLKSRLIPWVSLTEDAQLYPRLPTYTGTPKLELR